MILIYCFNSYDLRLKNSKQETIAKKEPNNVKYNQNRIDVLLIY